MYMRNFYTFLLCMLTVSLWAVPSVTDLDSWQLPDPEPKPVATSVARLVAKQPAAKQKVAPSKKTGKEITIEMTGTPSYRSASTTHDPSEIPVMRRSAAQLEKTLADKGRFYVLFNANVVSTIDTSLTGKDGTRYAFVQFGRDGENYRKFLFEGQGNQRLLAVADDVPGIVRLNTHYQINMPISEKDFKKAYPKAELTVAENEQDKKTYNTYQINGPVFFVFAGGKLTGQFSQKAELSDYLKSVNAKLPEVPVVQQEKSSLPPQEQEWERSRRQQPGRHGRNSPEDWERHHPYPPSKALVEGGTVNDRMNLPHVADPSAYNGPDLPPMIPSGLPSGAILIRDVDGKYMNR